MMKFDYGWWGSEGAATGLDKRHSVMDKDTLSANLSVFLLFYEITGCNTRQRNGEKPTDNKFSAKSLG